MSFSLKKVVPWGRSYAEYIQMFALDESDLKKRILGCSDGPASFNYHHTRKGGHITSIDPAYSFSVREIQERIRETSDLIYQQLKENKNSFKWNLFQSPDNLLKKRLFSMGEFLQDFEEGKEQGRYVPGELPIISFKDRAFDLSICSHFLLLYSEQLSFDFHLKSIRELLRVSSEVRIFPIVELNNQKSRHLDGLICELENIGCECSIRCVEYEFQIGGNQMLRISLHR